MRRDDGRENRRLVGFIVGTHAAHYTGNMANKATGESLKAARKGKAASVKQRGKQVAADVKAAQAKLPQWSKADVEEAFRRFQAANPQPKGELQHVDPFTLLVAVVLSAQATDAGVNKATPALFALADTP